jgi:hypothetical protein
VFARQDALIEEFKKFIRDVRRKGIPEEDIHLFICQHGGPMGEFICEEMYGYEAVAATHAKRTAQDVARRTLYVKLREGFINWIDQAEARRSGIPMPPMPAPGAEAPGKTEVLAPGGAAGPATPASASVGSATAEEYLHQLEQPKGGAGNVIRDLPRFLIGPKGRIAIGAVMVLLAALSYKGTLFGGSEALKSYNYILFAVALIISGFAKSLMFRIGLGAACLVAGPVAI